LQAEKKMDFAMLQSKFYSLITEHPQVLEDIQHDFKYIMVDEYQDTSPIQDRIFKLVAGKAQNLFVVGDQNQSIYKFRGASVRNFMRFKDEYPEAREYLLNVNFRSTRTIINLANQVFYAQVQKTLEAKRRAGKKIRLIWGETSEQTAEKAVRQITELKDSGIIGTYGDVALLFRSLKNHSHEFIKYLERARIPYITYGDGKFFERDEIQTMLFLLSYVTQELYIDNKFRDWQHWWRRDMFLNDFFGFSEETKEVIRGGKFKLFELETSKDFGNLGFKNKRDIDTLLKLNHLKLEVKQEKQDFKDIEKSKYSLLVIFYKILDYTEFFKRILGDRSPENREKLQNLGRLSQIIRKYIETRKKEDVKGFFWYIYHNAASFDQEKLEDPDHVKLLTVHRAKGMEFPVVFLCCLNERRFPLRYREDAFIPIPKDLLDAEDIEHAKAEFFEEEKRLFYVGLTRAQDVLIFTGSNKHRIQRWKKSRFLEGMPEDFFSDAKFGLKNEKHYRRAKETPMLDYSAINTFIDCPFRYDLVYNFGFTTPASFMQTLGFFIHNTLQRIHENMKKGQMLSPEQIEQIVRTYWIALPMSKKKNEDMRKSFVKRFIEYYHNAKDKFMEILAIEESFSHIDDNMIVKGKADLILKDKNGDVCLVDFKARTCQGIHETFVDRHLQIYDYCLDNEYHIDKLFAYTFYDHEMVSFSKNKTDTAGFLKEISENISQDNYPTNKNTYCPGCEFDFCC
jgi:DNA helicase-2/ATP-dependent DNA helicase PcrA